MKTHEFRPRHLIALILTVALTVPLFALSAGATDALPAEEPQKITDTLTAVMEESTEETTRVAIWLRDIDSQEALATESMPDYEARLAAIETAEANSTATNEIDRSIEVKRTALNLCYEPYTASVAEELLTASEIVYASEYLPFLIAELSDERIAEVSASELVESVDYYNDEPVEEEPAEAASEGEGGSASARSVIGTDGNRYYTTEENLQFINAIELRNAMEQKDEENRIRIGMLEAQPTLFPKFSNYFVHCHYENPEYVAPEEHASTVLDILTDTAPYAEFYCSTYTGVSDGSTPTMAGEMEWLLSEGVHIINLSLTLKTRHQGEFDAPDTYDSIARYLDTLVNQYNVTIVQAAGNHVETESSGIVSGAMAYSVITVGNYYRAISDMCPTSNYYSGTTLAFKPDIIAPGYIDPSIAQLLPDYGTSFSTPLVVGVVALLMDRYPALKTKPATVKAILTASTSEYCSYVPSESLYRTYGAGMINAGQAWELVQASQFVSDNAPKVPGLCDQHRIVVEGGRTLRIAIAYECIRDTANNSTVGDINLYIEDETLGRIESITLNNNVEIIEFTPPTSGRYYVFVDTFVAPKINGSKVFAEYGFAWFQYEAPPEEN